jgi:Mg-chelatase subunit ChlD
VEIKMLTLDYDEDDRHKVITIAHRTQYLISSCRMSLIIAVVITDGNSNNRAQTFAEAKKARASGIQVIAIGVGHGINQKELEGIASSPKSQYVYNAENLLR